MAVSLPAERGNCCVITGSPAAALTGLTLVLIALATNTNRVYMSGLRASAPLTCHALRSELRHPFGLAPNRLLLTQDKQILPMTCCDALASVSRSSEAQVIEIYFWRKGIGGVDRSEVRKRRRNSTTRSCDRSLAKEMRRSATEIKQRHGAGVFRTERRRAFAISLAFAQIVTRAKPCATRTANKQADLWCPLPFYLR